MEDEQVLEQETVQESAPAAGNILAPGENDFLKDPAFDRFRKDGGDIDTAKLAKSYRELEKKLGQRSDPEMETPDTEEGYEISNKLPEGMDPNAVGLKQLVSELHKRKANKAVVKYVTEAYTDMISQGVQMQRQQKQALINETEAKLRELWGVDFEREAARAQLAFKSVADDEDMQNTAELAASPVVMKLLAKFGRKLEEDSPAQSGTGLPQEDVKSMMKSEAYWNAKHPDHDKVKNMVNRHFQSAYRK